MRGPNRKIFLTFLVLSFLFAPSSLQAADSKLAWVKTVVASDTFTGNVVGVSDGDTISVMRGGRAVKVRTSKEVVAMAEPLRQFRQKEYTRVLNECGARVHGLGQTECESILMEHGAPCGKAKNGAYVYLHHGNHTKTTQKGSQEEYDRLLDEFGAPQKPPMECIKYLESLCYSYGQAKSAVQKYRDKKGLIAKR